MRHAVNRPANPARELFPSPHQSRVGMTPAQGVPAAAAPTTSTERLRFSRRSMVATLIAAIAPAAGMAVGAAQGGRDGHRGRGAGQPRRCQHRPAPTAESPALLALGVELEERQSAYRAAVARLEQARADAADLWPEPRP